MATTIAAGHVLSLPEQCALYPEMIARLEEAEGPDPELDRDIALLFEEPATLRFTADLDEVEAWLRKRYAGSGGWSVQYEPHIDAAVWANGATFENAEFANSAWRGPAGLYMRAPPANPAIALTLAELRALHDDI